jgi:translocation and assembly module TamB
MILTLLSLHGLAFWLNTDKGGAWISSNINTALNKTGYALEINNFGVSGFLGLEAKNLKLLHHQETLITGKNVTLNVNPTLISMKKLDVTLGASSLNIHAFPKYKKAKTQENTSQALEKIPEMYFKMAQMKVNIETLTLSENIVKGGVQTHLELKQDVALGEKEILTEGILLLSDIDSPLSPYIPHQLNSKVKISLNDNTLYIEKLLIGQPNYNASIQGVYGLTDQKIKIELNGEILNAQMVSNQLENAVSVAAMVDGAVNDFSGKISLSTQYKSQAISLTSKIDRKDTLIRLKEINGEGASININGDLSYDLDKALAEGNLSASLPDLGMIQTFVEGIEVKGGATIEGKIFSKHGAQAVTLDAMLSQIQYEDYVAEKLSAKIHVDDINDTRNLVADVKLVKGCVGAIDIESADLKIIPREEGFHATLLGKGYSYNPFSVDVEMYAELIPSLKVHLTKAILKGRQGNINASGRIENESINIDLKGERLVLAQLPFVDLSSMPVTVETISGKLMGNFVHPEFKTSYRFRPTIGDQYGASFEGETTFASGMLSNKLKGKGRGVKTLDGQFNIPLTLSLKPFNFAVPEQEKIQGSLTAQSDLYALSGLFLDDGYILKGGLDLNAKISGFLSDPQVDGSVRIGNASFVDTYNDIQLTDIAMNATLNNRELELSSFIAKDGEKKGSMNLSGNFNFEDISNPAINASLKMNGMHLLKNENYDAWVNADVSLKSKGGEYFISGKLSPTEISIRLPDHFTSSIPQLNIIDKEGKKKPSDQIFERTKLNVKFKADNKIFVSGRGLDVELEGLLDIGGTLKTPVVEGNLKALRGRYEEFGRRFALEKSLLRFQGEIPPSPYLDIEASTKIDDVKALVRITNSVEDPKIKLVSTPSRPEDEILSLILFGKDIQKISPFQAIQLANTLRRFSGKGGKSFDPLQEIQNLTGLDDIRVEGVGTEDAKAGAGKYISDKVYLEVEQGVGAGSGAASVEIEVTPNVSVESKTSQNGDSDIGLFWEWNY